MKLSKMVGIWEECFGPNNQGGDGGCIFKDCPLHNPILVTGGDPHDEEGQVKWSISGCTLMDKLTQYFKNRKAPERYPDA